MSDSSSYTTRKSRKLVIVLGAGASHEFGMPLGTQLKDAIVRYLEKAVESNYISNAGRQEYRRLYDAVTNVLQDVISGILHHSVGYRQKHIVVDRDCKCVELLAQYRRSLAFEG